MSESGERGILWRGWNDEMLRLIQERGYPALLFVADPHAIAWPLLEAVFRAMPKNAVLRELLHERYPALFIEADALPDELKLLGAGERYHIAVLCGAHPDDHHRCLASHAGGNRRRDRADPAAARRGLAALSRV
jgi:hypothetical protein